MPYKVLRTSTFKKAIEKHLTSTEKHQLERIFDQLAENPFCGDQIRYPFFREKRIGGKRIYYLIYSSQVIVLMVAISDKKDQDSTIEAIIDALDDYQRAVNELDRGGQL